MMSYTNDTGLDITSFTASWNYEKYRSGTRAVDWTFFTSTDGTSWTSVAAGNQSYASDPSNSTVFSSPQSIAKSVPLDQALSGGSTIYFRWTYTGDGGSTNGQGLGLDDFALAGSLVPTPGAASLLGLGGLLAARRRR